MRKKELTAEMRNKQIKKAKEEDSKHDKGTNYIKSVTDFMRVIQVSAPKDVQNKKTDGYVRYEHLEKPNADLLKMEKESESKVKWLIKPKWLNHYCKILEQIVTDRIAEQDLKFVDIKFRDIIVDNEKQYLVASARCIDFNNLSSTYDLPKLNYTEEQKKEIISKVVDKIEKEWQITPVK